ncbi:MAG: 50S ribosomal protein L11 methyltransferase [Candidatus Omnitrophica bacterium]|nr:50S ribosomal protein L11 methyltransferase [Candidatus Omnitrophota bacterium]
MKRLNQGLQERVPKIIYQLRIQATREEALNLVRAVLLSVGFSDTDLVNLEFAKTPAIELFDEHAQKLSQVEGLFKRLKLSGVKVILRRMTPKDWLTVWKLRWRPAPLTRRLDVVPVWYKEKYKVKRGRDYILMDTLMSFGTGLHETTRLMAQLIENKQGEFSSFLDIGTGTGILGLVALKYGAQEVMGIDIGQMSIEAALHNMKVNRLHFNVKKADIKTYRSSQKYDFVAANLVTNDLITHAKKIISFVKNNGYLAVSGISLDNVNKFEKAFAGFSLECVQKCEGQQWACFLYRLI